jgi:hypothetical protein
MTKIALASRCKARCAFIKVYFITAGVLTGSGDGVSDAMHRRFVEMMNTLEGCGIITRCSNNHLLCIAWELEESCGTGPR